MNGDSPDNAYGNEAAPPNTPNQTDGVKRWDFGLVAIVVIVMLIASSLGIHYGTKGDPQPPNTGIDPETGKVVSTFQLPIPPNPSIFNGGDEEEYQFIREHLASKQSVFSNVLSKLPSSLSDLPKESTDPIVQAAAWLTSQDATNAKEFAVVRFALASLYFALNGASWTNNDDWLSDSNHCDWHGVECCPKLMASVSCSYTDFFKFIQLDLFRNNLAGTIPETIGLFSDLQSIFFNENAIQGKLPTHFGELPKLHRMYMQHNLFTGQIPSAAQLDKSGLIGT